MSKTTILKPLELKEDLHFSKKHLQQQATIFFDVMFSSILKSFKISKTFVACCCKCFLLKKLDENITFFEFKNLLHLDEETYILSLRSKLMKLKHLS
jgi:hypothetical protein